MLYKRRMVVRDQIVKLWLDYIQIKQNESQVKEFTICQNNFFSLKLKIVVFNWARQNLFIYFSYHIFIECTQYNINTYKVILQS